MFANTAPVPVLNPDYKTRPSKQCKSLIWILIFVVPVLICYRKRRLRQLWQIFNYSGNFSSYRQCVITNALHSQYSWVILNRWSVWAEKCWSSGGPSSLQMTICKGTEEHRGGRIIQMVIFNNPRSSIPLILFIWFWRWNVIKICVWPCDMTSRSYFGKMNSTLWSVVALAMFNKSTSTKSIFLSPVRLSDIV